MQLGQTLLVVTKFRECVEFYRDALGFAIGRGDANGPLAAFQSGGQVLGILDKKAMPAGLGSGIGEGTPSGSVVIVVHTDDIDATYERLKARGVVYPVPPRDFLEWGVRSSVLQGSRGQPARDRQDSLETSAIRFEGSKPSGAGTSTIRSGTSSYSRRSARQRIACMWYVPTT